MTNTDKLKQILYSLHLTQRKAASLMGLSIQSFNMKLNNKREFTVKEIERMIKLFKIEDPIGIFFTQCVDLKSSIRRKDNDK